MIIIHYFEILIKKRERIKENKKENKKQKIKESQTPPNSPKLPQRREKEIKITF
ncbi:hypothetical protein HMPREF1419_01007 [Helicobacter pylori GAM263BFi]|nr:hypothetical protein HMPREF1419_01007 [Helicobacter pylori GAM263BFi]